MPNLKLLSEIGRLTTFNDLATGVEILDIYSNCLLTIIFRHHNDRNTTQREADARLICQMMLTKTLHLKNVLGGIEFTNQEGARINPIFDPTIAASIVRNTYETVGFFNLLFRHTTEQEQRLVIHCLWYLASLNYRQRFEIPEVGPDGGEELQRLANEIQEKAENERRRIQELTAIIERTNLYIGLSQRNKDKIHTMIRGKKFLVDFSGNNVNLLIWEDMGTTIGNPRGHFNTIYTYFSTYTHPSRISVEQFGLMFDDDQKFYIEMGVFNLKYFFWLSSVFIADYINLFPNVLATFETLAVRDQYVINFFNKFVRGDEFSINSPSLD